MGFLISSASLTKQDLENLQALADIQARSMNSLAPYLDEDGHTPAILNRIQIDHVVTAEATSPSYVPTRALSVKALSSCNKL